MQITSPIERKEITIAVGPLRDLLARFEKMALESKNEPGSEPRGSYAQGYVDAIRFAFSYFDLNS